MNDINSFLNAYADKYSQSLEITEESQVQTGSSNIARVFLSTSNGQVKLEEQKNATWGNSSFSYPNTIQILDGVSYQTIDGFGASFTDSSAYLIMNYLSDEQRNALYKNLFTNQGIQLSFIRQPIGASDFNRRVYSFDDVDSDYELNHFSIEPDKEVIIPALRLALQANPNLKIMSTPWSAPGWMKDTKSMIGTTGSKESHLLPQYYSSYAKYLLKYIQAYKRELGIDIYAITVQNEPLYAPNAYPGMIMNVQEQINFIKNYVGPLFRSQNITTKIMVFDHNFDTLWYPTQVLQDATVRQFVAGTAFHPYTAQAGHDVMTTLHNAFPDKDIWLTEASGGTWVPPYRNAFMDQTNHVVRTLRNWGKSVVWWNLALDETNGPALIDSSCRGVVTIDKRTRAVTYNVDYYTMGHASKFMNKGAVRIGSNSWKDDLETVAVKNTDGSIAVIVCNRQATTRKFQVQWQGKYIGLTIGGESCYTLSWSPATPPSKYIVQLRSKVNQQFVSLNGQKQLIANNGQDRNFIMVPLGNGKVALQSTSNQKFVCAEDAGTSPLVANRDVAQQWESFEVIYTDDGSVGLKADANGKIVAAENAGASPLIARSASVSGWEVFELISA